MTDHLRPTERFRDDQPRLQFELGYCGVVLNGRGGLNPNLFRLADDGGKAERLDRVNNLPPGSMSRSTIYAR